VFYGDSITDFWPTTFPAEFFPGKPYIGRGISGQSTPELVWRFQQDVLDLHPSMVVVLAGTNDVILPNSRMTPRQTIANIETMVKLAQRHGIHVIVCSILPVSHFPEPKQEAFTTRIKAINSTLQSRAHADHFYYLDYFGAMADQTGAMRSSLSPDGVHPNAAGYALMHAMAQSAIDQISG
jgi:lysophospholipase L1-like esterase